MFISEQISSKKMGKDITKGPGIRLLLWYLLSGRELSLSKPRIWEMWKGNDGLSVEIRLKIPIFSLTIPCSIAVNGNA